MVNNYAVFNMSLVEEQAKSTFTQLGKTQDLQVKIGQGMRESKHSARVLAWQRGQS